MKFIFLFALVIAPSVFAAPLTIEAMKNCKNIAVIAGTYDPFTYGHENMAIAIKKDTKFDCVVFLPTPNPPHKLATPLQSRYEMLEAALKDQPGMFYPTPEDMNLSPKDYVKKMKSFSKEKTVFAVLGSDLSPKNYMYYINEFRLDPDGYIITGRNEEPEIARAFKNKPHLVVYPENSTSSTIARTWFSERPEKYYSEARIAADALPSNVLREGVSRYILDNGLYFAVDAKTTRGPLQIAASAVKNGLNKTGLFHPLRQMLVDKHKQDNLTHIEIEGKKYELKKHLGSGLTADAYVFNYEGRDVVIKIANQRMKSGSSIVQDVLIGRFLNEKTSIKVPEVFDVGPNGEYKIAEKVGGESLGEYLKRTNGVIEASVDAQLRTAVADMVKLSSKANLKLDLSVDNLKIWNGKVYLIDAGPIPPDVKHPMSYEEFQRTWGKHLKLTVKSHCSGALKGLLLSLRN